MRQLHLNSLGIKTLNRLFKGNTWHFLTVANKADSEVTKKLKSEKSKLPFYLSSNNPTLCINDQ